MATASQSSEVFMLFFPFMARGHIRPMVDMAMRFASRGVRSTVLTTPGNADYVRAATERQGRHRLELLLIPFPSAEVGLPEGLETLTDESLEIQFKFFAAVDLLRAPFEHVLRDHRPSCVVSDMLLHWTAASSAVLGVPRLTFHVMGFAALCTLHAIDRCLRAGKEFPSSTRSDFVEIPGLPHRVELRRDQLPHTTALRDWFGDITDKVCEAERESYGTLVNSFYELEPEYANHYRAVLGLRVWHVGPVHWPRASDTADSTQDPCLAWLDAKPPRSVVYVGFGTMFQPNTPQLHEIARGLEASGCYYIWVSRGDDWLPEGLEESSGKRMVVKGWAPQVEILEHAATGAFLSHCGWNAVLEAVCAGVPLITWPVYADQLDSARLVGDDLGVGVQVGPEAWGHRGEDEAMASAEEVARAVARVMDGGEEAVGMRRRMEELRAKGRSAVEEGGSSHVDMGRFIGEIAAEQACEGATGAAGAGDN